MNMDSPQARRKLLIIISAMDALLSGVLLLTYFGFFPFDISGWGIPGWVILWGGGIWFVSALGVLVYQLTRTDIE